MEALLTSNKHSIEQRIERFIARKTKQLDMPRYDSPLQDSNNEFQPEGVDGSVETYKIYS